MGKIHNVVLQAVALCSVADGCQPFGATNYHHLQMTDRVGWYHASKEYTAAIFTFVWRRRQYVRPRRSYQHSRLPDYTASQSTRLEYG
jgi:hypothetical protein